MHSVLVCLKDIQIEYVLVCLRDINAVCLSLFKDILMQSVLVWLKIH